MLDAKIFVVFPKMIFLKLSTDVKDKMGEPLLAGYHLFSFCVQEHSHSVKSFWLNMSIPD